MKEYAVKSGRTVLDDVCKTRKKAEDLLAQLEAIRVYDIPCETKLVVVEREVTAWKPVKEKKHDTRKH